MKWPCQAYMYVHLSYSWIIHYFQTNKGNPVKHDMCGSKSFVKRCVISNIRDILQHMDQ